MNTIYLDTREKQKTFMDPVRQDMLRLLHLAARPMTPKELGDRLGVSASAATFHLKKLLGLGLVALDHTETIRGITARYYRALDVNVNFGLPLPDGDAPAHEAFLRRAVDGVLAGVLRAIRHMRAEGLSQQQAAGLGDLSNGVVYLTKEEAAALEERILAFLTEKETPRPGTQPYEYLWMAYNAAEVPDDVG